MGLWDTFVRALGLERDPVVRELGPVALTPAAERRLSALPPGHGAHLHLVSVPAGWLVRVDEGPVEAPHPGFGGAPVACDDLTVGRLAGVHLDHEDGRWRVIAEVDVRARETPNPDGRLYKTDRVLAQGRVYAARRGPGAPWLADALLAREDVRGVLLRDHTVSVERVPGAPWPPIDAAVALAVRAWALALGEPAIPRPADPSDDALLAAARHVLEHHVAPAIHADGGDIELLGVEDGVARVRMVGACRSCPASVLTLKGGVERVLKEAFPGEIERVEAEEG